MRIQLKEKIVVRLLKKDLRINVGVHKPGVYGDKPSFM
jgi:hypothetical protein